MPEGLWMVRMSLPEGPGWAEMAGPGLVPSFPSLETLGIENAPPLK